MPPKRRAAAAASAATSAKLAALAPDAPPVPAAAAAAPLQTHATKDLFADLAFTLPEPTIAGMSNKAFAKLITDHGGAKLPNSAPYVISGTISLCTDTHTCMHDTQTNAPALSALCRRAQRRGLGGALGVHLSVNCGG